MRATTCPTHPGIRIDHHPCYRCSKEEVMSGIESFTISNPDTGPADEEDEYLELERNDTVADALARTKQLCLSETLFPPVRRADVPMVKIALSGTIELTQEQYQSYLDGGTLGPGAVVDVRALGYVIMPGAAWVKRTEGSGEKRETWHEREGRIKIKLMDLGALAPTGEEWIG